jgi:hypothetical protein
MKKNKRRNRTRNLDGMRDSPRTKVEIISHNYKEIFQVANKVMKKDKVSNYKLRRESAGSSNRSSLRAPDKLIKNLIDEGDGTLFPIGQKI